MKKVSLLVIFLITLFAGCMLGNVNPDKIQNTLWRDWIVTRTEYAQSPIVNQNVIMTLNMIAAGIDSTFVGINEFREVMNDSEKEKEMLKNAYKELILLIDLFKSFYEEALMAVESPPEPQVTPGSEYEVKMGDRL